MKLRWKEKNNIPYLDRADETTRNYIAECAAMSMNKAIIGLTELNALEKLKDNDIAGGFRISRAINSYYIIYHLFVCVMLMDQEYDISLEKKKKKLDKTDCTINIEVDSEALSSTCELPETWINCKDYEQDISSSIQHFMIKDYCDKLRKKDKSLFNEPIKILYDEFVRVDVNSPNSSIAGLYEKVCYIRDRVLYRPSVVVGNNNQIYVTSLNVRNEIESLPKSSDFNKIISQIIESIRVACIINKNAFYYYFLYNLWECSVDDNRDSNIFEEYTEEEIDSISINYIKEENILELNNYISQHIEIADKARLFNNIEEFWNNYKFDFEQFRKEYTVRSEC